MTSSESLSQQEIDLLFGGGTTSEPAPGKSSDRSDEVQVYDFRRPSLISKDRQRILEGMYGRLSKTLESWLVGRVRSHVEAQLLAVEQFTFGEFVLSLTTPCTAYVFDIAGTGGHQGVIDFGRDLSFYLVDRLLGGNGPVEILDRALTPLERMVVRIMADMVLQELVDIWADHINLELDVSRFESVPDMLQIVNRDDPVLVANVEVDTSDFSSNVLICLPFVVLERFFTGPSLRKVAMTVGSEEERAADKEAVEWSVRMTEVDLSVRFPEVTLSVEELLELGVGSILATGIPVGSDLDLLIEDTPTYRVTPGQSGGNLAVRIREQIVRGPVEEPKEPKAITKGQESKLGSIPPSPSEREDLVGVPVDDPKEQNQPVMEDMIEDVSDD